MSPRRRAARVCSLPGCPELVDDDGSKCEAHRKAAEQVRNASRTHYKGEWARRSRDARRRQPWCGCTDTSHGHGEPCGARSDLTADHVVPRSLEGGVAVLCRSCNTKKGGRR